TEQSTGARNLDLAGRRRRTNLEREGSPARHQSGVTPRRIGAAGDRRRPRFAPELGQRVTAPLIGTRGAVVLVEREARLAFGIDQHGELGPGTFRIVLRG